MIVEMGICVISMRGSILDTTPRASIHYWLYGKLGKSPLNILLLSVVRCFKFIPLAAWKINKRRDKQRVRAVRVE